MGPPLSERGGEGWEQGFPAGRREDAQANAEEMSSLRQWGSCGGAGGAFRGWTDGQMKPCRALSVLLRSLDVDLEVGPP